MFIRTYVNTIRSSFVYSIFFIEAFRRRGGRWGVDSLHGLGRASAVGVSSLVVGVVGRIANIHTYIILINIWCICYLATLTYEHEQFNESYAVNCTSFENAYTPTFDD